MPYRFGPFLVGDLPTYKITQDEFPFQVVTRSVRDSNGAITGFQLGVISNSHLFNSEDKDTYEEDNNDWGLLDDDQTTGWINFQAGTSDNGGAQGKKVWLEIKLDASDQSITEINVRFGAVGGGPDSGNLWDEYPDPIAINTDNDPFQEYYNQIIAELTDPEQDPRPGITLQDQNGNKVQVTQLLSTNLMIVGAHSNDDADHPNLPLLVAVPWNDPGTTTDGAADEINSISMTPWEFGGGPGSGTRKIINPWQMTYSIDANQNPYVTIHPGTINGMVPGNIFNKQYIGDTSLWYEILLCQTDGHSINYAYIYMDTSDPTVSDMLVTQGAAPSQFHIVLGIVQAGKVAMIERTPLTRIPVISFVTSKDSPGPWEEPFIRWWTWR